MPLDPQEESIPYRPGRVIRPALRLALASVAVATLGVTLWAWQLSASRRPSPPPAPKQAASRYPAPKMEIRGFQFSHATEGQTVLGISADAFRIEHKKLGVFRFGLMQEAVLDNARIELHMARATPPPGLEEGAASPYKIVVRVHRGCKSGGGAF